MQTYYVKYYDVKWNEVQIKADNISNLRKRLIKDGVDAHIDILVGGNLKHVGMLNLSINDNKTWFWRANNKTWRVSPKTGRLLDYDKYWRYV